MASCNLQLPFGGLYENDEDGMIEAMMCITDDKDVFEFRHTLCDIFSDEYNDAIDTEEMVKQGDSMMEANRQEEAVQAYMKALEASPNNLMVAIRLIAVLPGLNRTEEAVVVAIAALRVSENDEKLEKMAKLQLISAYAKLGYGKMALEEAKSVNFDLDSMKKSKDDKKKSKDEKSEESVEDKVSKAELLEAIKLLIEKTPQQKEINSEDFASTLTRLFKSKDNQNPAIVAFLLHHLKKHHSSAKLSKKETLWTKITEAGLFTNVSAIAALEKAFLHADFQKWNLMECVMVAEYFDLVTTGPDKVESANRAVLFAQPVFQTFLRGVADSVAKNDFLKFLAHAGNDLHFDLVASWLQSLLEFVKKEPSFLKSRPFNQLNWHAKLIYANLVGLMSTDFEVLPNLKRMFSHKEFHPYFDSCSLFVLALKQDWFPERVAKLDKNSIVESLNLLDMTLHVNFHARNDLLLQPPMEKIMQLSCAGPMVNREGYSPKEVISLYETLLIKCPSIASYCRDRPGLWMHLEQRLDFLSKNMDKFGGHGGEDLEISLNIINLLLESKGEVDGYVEDEDFVTSVSRSFLRIMSAKVDEPTELLFRLRQLVIRAVVGFSLISDDIPLKLAQPGLKKSGNIFECFIDMKSFDAISAHFFYLLLKSAPSVQLKCLENHPNMITFLARLLTLIYENKERKREEIANICLCLMRSITSKSLVSREVLMQSILFSSFEEPQKLVTKLAGLIRPTRRARKVRKEAVLSVASEPPKETSPLMPLCAGLLLAALVKKDPTFRNALVEEDRIYGKVSDEYRQLLAKAVEQGKPDI